jgi:nucleotide-binding universal stress UspA family protein
MQILVATGGSSHSEAALRFSLHILRPERPGNTLTVLTVLKRETDRGQVDQILTHATLILAPRVPQPHMKVRVGHPAEEIIREAEEHNYDLVIVGERQHHRLVTRFILGATAERVVEHAPCPVIVAKGKTGPLRRVLLCDSGLKAPSLVGRFTSQLPELIRSELEITVLHVMSQISAGPGVRGEQLRAEAEQLIEKQAPEGEILERDLQILKRLNIAARPKIRHGFVVDEIIAEADGAGYDLVVIGTHRGEGWRRILLDDLTRQIIAQVDRPVLVVR